MNNSKVNITLLALLQILIFIAPVTIKAAHHHEPDQVISCNTHPSKTVSKDIGCFICSFEFVVYNIPHHPAYFYFHRAYTLELTVSIEKVFKPLLSYISLRAPPQF